MSKEDSNQNGEDYFKAAVEGEEESKHQDGDDSGESSSKGGETTDILAQINEKSGKSFKDIDGLVKSLKEADKLASKKGRDEKQQDSKPQSNDRVSEEILKVRNKDLEHVMDDIRTIAKSQGKDVFSVVDENPWLAEKAKAIAEAKAKESKAKSKVGDPSHQIEGDNDLDFASVDLNNKDHVNWLNAKAGRIEKYNDWLVKNFNK